MSHEKYVVSLRGDERKVLSELIKKGKGKARHITRAKILLLADKGRPDEMIATSLHTSVSTIEHARQRFVEGNVAGALNDPPRPRRCRKLVGKSRAWLVATAYSTPPEGRATWTMHLLADRLIELNFVNTISDEPVRVELESELNLRQPEQWCIPTANSAFVSRLEDILELYQEPFDPKKPVVTFNERRVQLISETRRPLPARPGRPERYDHEYHREGTANLFEFFQPLAGWRHLKVTGERVIGDFARWMKDLADVHFPVAEVIRVVVNSLNNHDIESLYETFEPAEARWIARKLEFHYTPKHGSWLNMVEIEFAVLSRQCLARRIPDMQTLTREVAKWEEQRNAQHATVNWRFTPEVARERLKELYPSI